MNDTRKTEVAPKLRQPLDRRAKVDPEDAADFDGILADAMTEVHVAVNRWSKQHDAGALDALECWLAAATRATAKLAAKYPAMPE